MTIAELFLWLNAHPLWVVGGLAVPPLVLFFLSQIDPPNKTIYWLASLALHSVALPGIAIAALTAWRVVVSRIDLQTINVLTEIGPVVSAGISFAIVQRTLGLANLPGMGRLTGFVVTVVMALGLAFVLQRVWFGVFLTLSAPAFLLMLLASFLLLRWAWSAMVGRRPTP